MRISDWSSDVCSSDLVSAHRPGPAQNAVAAPDDGRRTVSAAGRRDGGDAADRRGGSDRGDLPAAPWGRPCRHRLAGADPRRGGRDPRSEEHTSELQSLMRISYAVFCLKKKTTEKRLKQ